MIAIHHARGGALDGVGLAFVGEQEVSSYLAEGNWYVSYRTGARHMQGSLSTTRVDGSKRPRSQPWSAFFDPDLRKAPLVRRSGVRYHSSRSTIQNQA